MPSVSHHSSQLHSAPSTRPPAALKPAAPVAKPGVVPPRAELSPQLTKKGAPPLSLGLDQPAAGAFVKNTGGQFTLAGKPFRYVGANMYSLAKEPPEVQEKMLKDAAQHGFTVIRFWAYENYGATPEVMQRLCDLAGKYKLKLIPCLADRWVMSDADRKDDHFYKQGYQREYLPRVEKMVTQLKDRPEIMIWELINEPETESFEAMHHFTTTVSQAIKAKAPNHLISLGTLGGVGDRFGSQLSRFSGENFRRLYAIPTLDAASIHNYAYDATVLERLDLYHRFKGDPQTGTYFGKADQVLSWGSRQVDELALKTLGTQLYNPLTLRGTWENLNQQNVQAARELGKPLYVGEVGFKKFHGENRANLLRVDLARTMQAGAQGYLLWSYEAQNASQDGHDYGFKDADQFAPVVQEWNRYFAQLAAHPEQAKTLKPPAGDNFSLRHQTGNYLERTDKALGDWIPDLLYDWMK